MQLEGAVIAITGAAGGLGSAMARRFSEQGARLALIDLGQSQLEELAATLASSDPLMLACDITDEQAVSGAFATILQHFGQLDVLVNNAGITRDALLLKFRDGVTETKMSLDDWNAVINVNLNGVFLCGREAAEHMARRGAGGAIINISSIARSGNVGQSNYAASKAGVAAMTVTWARELARYGIRVNAISPGVVNTEMVRAMKPGARERLESMIPAGRVGEPDEVAQTAQFILENDYLNGRNLEVDGGMRL